MKTTIYSTDTTPIHTLQAIIDDAMIARWRSDTAEETQTQSPRGLLISGANIQHVHQNEESST